MAVKRSFVLCGLLCGMLLFALMGCASGDDFEPRNPIVYGLTLQPSGFDPHVHASAELGIALRQVYDTLVYRHPQTNEIVPGLATGWTISDDGLVYTFMLREGVTFHDGTPFNAQAVAANLDRIVAPETGSQRARFMLGPYSGHNVLDTYVIQITLSERFVPLLDSLSQVYLGMASPTAFNEYSPTRYQFHQVGTGPYRFIKFTPGDEIILRRNEAYTWGPEFYDLELENTVDQITYRFFTDAATRATAIESGEAHIMGEIPPAFALTLAGTDAELLPVEVPGLPLQFMMNTARPPTDDLLVRQALIHATNRPLIVDTVYRGFSPVAWGPLSRATLHYSRAVEGTYPYDVDIARASLEAAGFEYVSGVGFVLGEDDDAEPLEIIVLVPPWGGLPDVAQLMQAQWREIGVNARLVQVSGLSALRERVESGDYHLVAFDSAGFDPYVMNSFYASDGANNFTNYQNPRLDAALITAVQELSPETRRVAYAEIQQFIMGQALILPIRDYINLNATVPTIDRLTFDSYGWFPLMHNVANVAD